MTRFMFDTDIFGKILKDNIVLDIMKKSKHQYYITHIQLDELNKTPHEIKERQRNTFKTISQELIPTESAVFGVSRVRLAKIGDSKLYSNILKELNKKRPENRNNSKDALIGETALRNSIILVTDDNALYDLIEKMGQAIKFETFVRVIKS
jgi:predicted nucleic acid-binding protein